MLKYKQLKKGKNQAADTPRSRRLEGATVLSFLPACRRFPRLLALLALPTLLRWIPHKILNIFMYYKLNLDENWRSYNQNSPKVQLLYQIWMMVKFFLVFVVWSEQKGAAFENCLVNCCISKLFDLVMWLSLFSFVNQNIIYNHNPRCKDYQWHMIGRADQIKHICDLLYIQVELSMKDRKAQLPRATARYI